MRNFYSRVYERIFMNFMKRFIRCHFCSTESCSVLWILKLLHLQLWIFIRLCPSWAIFSLSTTSILSTWKFISYLIIQSITNAVEVNCSQRFDLSKLVPRKDQFSSPIYYGSFPKLMCLLNLFLVFVLVLISGKRGYHLFSSPKYHSNIYTSRSNGFLCAVFIYVIPCLILQLVTVVSLL